MDSLFPIDQAMPQPIHEGLLQLSDVSLFVRQFGTTGPAVVLIHGGPDWDQSYFFPFIAPVARSCRLITFDLRGCGRSFCAVRSRHRSCQSTLPWRVPCR